MSAQLPFGDVSLATNPEPRCPCVLLIDVSGSMCEVVGGTGTDAGYTFQQDGKTYRAVTGGVSRIERVNEGLRAYQADLLADPLAAQRVEVCVITFGDAVKTVVPFVGAADFIPPTLSADGDTAMGAALLEAMRAIDERKRQYKANGLHYYRPWIFLITDGAPNDAWRDAAAKVRQGEDDKKFALFAVGVEGADFDVLKEVSIREPLKLAGYKFREMFVWLSQSQRSVSRSQPGQEHGVKLMPPTGWASL